MRFPFSLLCGDQFLAARMFHKGNCQHLRIAMKVSVVTGELGFLQELYLYRNCVPGSAAYESL